MKNKQNLNNHIERNPQRTIQFDSSFSTRLAELTKNQNLPADDVLIQKYGTLELAYKAIGISPSIN